MTSFSDLFCEDFGASEPLHSRGARRMPICGIPAAFGTAELRGKLGSYITLFPEELSAAAEAVAEAISLSSSPTTPKRILVAAFGNGSVACDALGCRTADRLLVTGEDGSPGLPETFVVKAGVTAKTGLSSAETVSLISRHLMPELAICIDSLAAAAPERLFRVIQITDAGIAPGSGVASHTAPVTSDETGVPTIAVGVPTVLKSGPHLLTDAKVEASVSECAAVLAGGINLFFTKYCGYAQSDGKMPT